MGAAGGSVPALPGFRELVHATDGERDHEDNQNEAKGHETAEGEPPIKRPQVGLAVHEHANDHSGGQGSRCGHHHHFRLDVPSAFHRLTLRVLKQETLTGRDAKLDACCQDEQPENVPVLLGADARVAWRDHKVVAAILVLAVEGSRQWL